MIKIRIGGWAGQGTVLSGQILAKSLALDQGYEVIQTRSYSAAVRSGIAFSDIIADKDEVNELIIDTPDYLILLYQKTLDEWKDIVGKVDNLIVDSTRVADVPDIDGNVFAVPAGEIADGIGTAKAANIVLLGALAAVTDVISLEALKRTVQVQFPEKYVELNLRAIGRGYDYINENLKI
ncbi:MAG: 2-oxoacid:acceptor oxidoreductase family protein [Thermoplasmata archaeon]